jgi:uncharacterized protein (DUF1501 family)
MNFSRRHFLRMAGYGVGGSVLTSFIHKFSLGTALAQGGGDYRALVCIFLAGGNDGNNTVIPYDDYASYAAVRPSTVAFSVPQANLLQITPPSLGATFGLHPTLPDLQALFQQGKLAILSNVGPLLQPLTRAQYMNPANPRPIQLFSHSNQVSQWQTSRSDGSSATGWGGRVADLLEPSPPPVFPMITSIAGTPIFTIGQNTRPLAIQAAPTALSSALALTGPNTGNDDRARFDAMAILRSIDRTNALVAATSDTTQQALDVGRLLDTVDVWLATVFPNTSLGNQLKQVALLIKANQQVLGLSRQIFFTNLGGYDTHQNQNARQGPLLTQLNNAMKAFYDATVELGLSANVTTFTLSDFSRTFQPAGNGTIAGTDHAWGNHQFIMGDGVVGGDFYGVPGSNGTVYPTLQLSGADDTDNRGRWIPTSSVDQYGATLAKWYGVDPSQLATVFPGLPNFPAGPDLGFMG